MSSGCSKALGTLFGVLFIFASVAGLLIYQVEFVLLEPEPYINAIQEGELASRLTDIASKELAARLELDPCTITPELCAQFGGPPAYLTQLTEQEWQQILGLLITPEWIGEQAEVVVRALFQALDPGEEGTVISVDIRPVKNRLAGESGQEIINLMLATLPTCTASQMAELSELLLSGGSVEQLLVCSPPPEILRQVMPILSQQLNVLIAEIPDQFSIDLRTIDSVADGRGVISFRSALRQGLYLSALVAAGSLLMVVVFSVRSLRDFFVWIGWPVLSVGLIALIISLSIQAFSGLVFWTFIDLNTIPMMQAETFDFMRDLIQAVVTNLLRGFVFLSFGLTIFGLLCLIISRIFPAKKVRSTVGQRPENLL